jgi:hypothetical protein
LTKIGQEGRNRKATKLDDAEVPEYIWYDHVFEDGAQKWTEDQKKAFPCAARILQEAMLKFWKRRVRRSFLLGSELSMRTWQNWTRNMHGESNFGMADGILLANISHDETLPYWFARDNRWLEV